MKDILDILGEALLIATFQPRRQRTSAIGSDQTLTEGPRRFQPERVADRKRSW